MLNNIEIVKKEYKKYLFRLEKEVSRGESAFINFRHEVDKQRKTMQLESDNIQYYSDIVEELTHYKTALKYTPRLEDNYPFLRNLLFTRKNGIASAGATLFKGDDFEMLIKNNEFMSALKEHILNPNYFTFTKVSDIWKNLLPEGTVFPAICVNRVACACSRDVSTFPEQNRFHKLFKWLYKSKVIEIPKEALKWDWYSKNILATQALKELLEVGDTDLERDALTGFFWTLYDIMILNDKLEELREDQEKGLNICEAKKPNNENIKEIILAEVEKLGEYADLNHIDVSEVTDMSSLFEEVNFDGDISKWNVSNVKSMKKMFFNCGFSQDISNWNVSNVENMDSMFAESYFNADISSWNTQNVKNMANMFAYSNFNQDISSWNVGNVTTMENMFAFSSFCGNLSDWDVSNVTDMQSMFEETSFDCDISKWNIKKVESFASMFFGNSNFNHDISAWEVQESQNTQSMLADCPLEQQPPHWYK